MTTNKQTASNAAVRALLTLLGEKRDFDVLGLAPGELRNGKIKSRLHDEFQGRCAYCQKKVGESGHIDHLIPINRDSAGLHMLGNLVLACKSCNSKKGNHSLSKFLRDQGFKDAEKIQERLEDRARNFGVIMNSGELRALVNSLYSEVSNLVSSRADRAMGFLPKPNKTTTNIAKNMQKKSEFDFSDIGEKFPVGSWVVAELDEKVGEVTDYSLQGHKGKRKPYVTFVSIQDGKPYRRSPNQLRRIKGPKF